MYSKQKAQLAHLSRSITKLYATGEWHHLTPELKRKTISRLFRLWAKLRMYLSPRELKRIAAAVALFAGLSINAQAQQFGNLQTNPFGLNEAPLNTGNSFKLVDLDGDGDLDMIGANFNYATDSTSFFYRENTGTKTNPQFGNPMVNPFGLTTYISLIHMSAAIDMDNDGDLDLITTSYGDPDPILYFENVGTKLNPAFDLPVLDPFGINTTENFGLPALAASDIDDDGDPDILFFDYSQALFFENKGTPSSPSFGDPVSGAFNISISNAGPFGVDITDLDKDGDPDIMLNNFEYGGVLYFENTGTLTDPDFASAKANPFGLSSLSGKSLMAASAADLDGDGDMDLLFSDFEYSYSTYSYSSNFYFVENTTPASVNQSSELESLKIYPQPVHGSFTIDLSHFREGTAVVTITSVNGVICFSETVDGEMQQVIPVQNLEPGVYLVEVNNNGSRSTGKLLIQ